MKITKSQLRKIIKEEVQVILNEQQGAEDRIFNAKGETQNLRGYITQISDALEDAAEQFEKETRTKKNNKRSKLMTKQALMRIVAVMEKNKGLGRSSIEDATTALLNKFKPPSPERDMVALQYFEKLMDEAGVSQ